MGSMEDFPLSDRIANAFVSYILYIGKMIWPSHLAVYYPYPGFRPIWQVVGVVFTISLIKGSSAEGTEIDDLIFGVEFGDAIDIHEDIPLSEVFRKIPERTDLDIPHLSVNHHHPGLIPDRRRFLGDQFFRQVICEFFQLHLKTKPHPREICGT